MYWIVALLALSHVALIGLGLFWEFRPPATEPARRRLRGTVAVNLLTFTTAMLVLLYLALDQAMAQGPSEGTGNQVSLGLGLSLLGIGLPTMGAAIGAGIAVSGVGAAGLAVLAEKPEIFGRTLVYLGLAEGIAIYGIVISILLLGKV